MGLARQKREQWLSSAVAVLVLVVVAADTASAQWVATPRQAFAGSSRFAAEHSAAARVINAADYERSRLYERLWRASILAAGADSVLFVAGSGSLLRGMRIPAETPAVAPDFAKLVPEVATALDWGRSFRRALLGELSNKAEGQARSGKIAELVSQYRTRGDLAVSVVPKALDLTDGQPHSLKFRQRLPRTNGLGWATRWVELALLESLVADSVPDSAPDAAIARLTQMLGRGPDSTPFLLPIAPGVAPAFARRYPDAAGILDNLHMLEDGIADVLIAADVPRSAKRMELRRLLDAYRSDTVASITVAQWFSSIGMIGANNMGGPGVGFSAELPVPTMLRGASMVGMSTHDMSTMGQQPPDSGGHSAHPTTAQTKPSLEFMLAIYSRMMADPVIRERVATDPVLQNMIAGISLDSTSTRAATAMPGMDHANMPGMTMTPQTAATMLKGTPEQRARALDFVVRLLSDPAVEARIHTSAELHALWSDTEVQKRLTELKRKPPTGP